MEEPLLVRYRWTDEELIRAQRYHHRQSCRPAFRFALHGLFALMLLAGAGPLGRGGGEAPRVGAGALLGAGIYWFAIRPFYWRWWTRRRFRRRPDRDIEIEWRLGPDRIQVRSALVGQSDFGWEAIAKVVRTADGFLFYTLGDELYHWLPRRGFADEHAWTRGDELARERIGIVRDVS